MEDIVEIWSERQRLRQHGEMDCGVSVFTELTGISREEFLRDWPEAIDGISLDRLRPYLGKKGFEAHVYDSKGEYPLPCAHLVASGGYHWVYEAANGGIHDPSPVFEWVPPRTIKLATHYSDTVLTVAIVRSMQVGEDAT